MFRISLLAALLLSLVPLAVFAQDGSEGASPATPADPTVTELTLEKLDAPPQIKLEFIASEEVHREALFRADPKLLEQKFFAAVELVLPSGDSNERGARKFHSALAGDSFSGLGGGTFGGRGGGQAHRRGYAKVFSEIIEQIDKERRPDSKFTAFFTSEDVDSGYLRATAQTMQREPTGRAAVQCKFFLLGATREEVEERAATLVTLIDQGVLRPDRLALWEERQKYAAAWKAARMEREVAEKSLPGLRKELEQYADYTPDMLPGLRLQQLQLDVDLAGVLARIKACDKLLAGMPSPTRKQQIEDAKIAAEIELAGFEARRAKSEQFLQHVKKKIELQTSELTTQARLSGITTKLGQSRRALERTDRELASHQLDAVFSGKVAIQAHEWTRP